MGSAGVTVLSLCSGVGMLDEGVCLATGGRVLAYVEREACAAAVLLARMEDAALEQAPVWCGDLREFDGAAFHGLVDVLCAGVPCQPYSLAGKRLGNADERSFGADGDGVLPGVLAVIAACAPAVVFFENVPAWVMGREQWFRSFGGELCALGYEIAEPCFLRAADMGAPHERERVFLLALATRQRCAWQRIHESTRWLREADFDGGGGPLAAAEGREDDGRGSGRVAGAAGSRRGEHPAADPGGGDVGHASGQCAEQRGDAGHLAGARGGAQGEAWERERRGDAVEHTNTTVGHAEGELREQSRGSRPRFFPPGPRELGDWAVVVGHDGGGGAAETPHVVTYGHLAPAIEPGLCVLADGLALVVDEGRADQLRCAGNGVVALAGAAAFASLVLEMEGGAQA